MKQARPTASLLMCPPQHFAVTYAINPWMDPAQWASENGTLTPASHREWTALHQRLTELSAQIELVTPVAGLPDLVFTANAAVVLDGKALLARFRHPQRRREEPHFETAFHKLQGCGLVHSVAELPDGLVLEGAGDCVWDQTRQLFWMGHGPRSDAAAAHHVARAFGVETVPLELVDQRFYHLDTALCPLTGGEIIYFPRAFSAAGRAAIRERLAPHEAIEIGDGDACRFAANAVCIDRAIVLSACSERLRSRLAKRGYQVIETPLDSFRRSGGSAFCLTLRLDRASRTSPAVLSDEAA